MVATQSTTALHPEDSRFSQKSKEARMKRNAKGITILAITALLLGLSACGGGADKGLVAVDTLLTGYVKGGPGPQENITAFLEGHGALSVQPTVSLVRDGAIRLIVDPGIMSDDAVKELRRDLKSHKLEFKDITHVFVTHQHIDHTKNIGLFENAKVYDYASTYTGDRWERHLGEFAISPNIRIIQTPGHTLEDASLVVKTKEGVVVLTDVWWFADRTPDKDPLVEDQALLDASRKVVLGLPGLIRVITSHGGSFDVKK